MLIRNLYCYRCEWLSSRQFQVVPFGCPVGRRAKRAQLTTPSANAFCGIAFIARWGVSRRNLAYHDYYQHGTSRTFQKIWYDTYVFYYPKKKPIKFIHTRNQKLAYPVRLESKTGIYTAASNQKEKNTPHEPRDWPKKNRVTYSTSFGGIMTPGIRVLRLWLSTVFGYFSSEASF